MWPLRLDMRSHKHDERFVPPDHPLRKLDEAADFSFILDLVADRYARGNDRPPSTPYSQGLGASGNFGTDRGFTGQTVDAAAGLYWFASRSYDPSIGRFVQPDTVVPDWTNPQALNRYAYALNNPLKFVDPSGHTPAPPLGNAWIAMDLYIQPASVGVVPGLDVRGDERGPGYRTDPGASRVSVVVSIDNTTLYPCVDAQVNPSSYFVLGREVGPFDPSSSNRVQVFRGDDGTIRVTYDVSISGWMEGTAPRLNGEVTFTPDGRGGYTTSGRRDGFPWMEAYSVDTQGKATQIVERPALRGDPSDLYAIEEQPSILGSLYDELNRTILRDPPQADDW